MMNISKQLVTDVFATVSLKGMQDSKSHNAETTRLHREGMKPISVIVIVEVKVVLTHILLPIYLFFI